MFVIGTDKILTNVGIHLCCKMPIWSEELMKYL
jgi:hypothetical protein